MFDYCNRDTGGKNEEKVSKCIIGCNNDYRGTCRMWQPGTEHTAIRYKCSTADRGSCNYRSTCGGCNYRNYRSYCK